MEKKLKHLASAQMVKIGRNLMHIQHNATIKNMDGVVDVDIYIINNTAKRYVYHLSSEFAAEKFHKLYRKGKLFHGKALAILNQFKIKEESNV